MSGLLVLLGLSAYFILTSTFPLSDSLHFLNDVVGTNNISNSRPVVTDASANDYLTLLSAPFDVDNPNPVENGYIRDDSDGAGTTIFVLDNGANLEKYPDERCLDQRRIDTWLIEQDLRTGGPLTQDELNSGDYFPPPDNMDDTAAGYPDGQFHGHGTQVAIVAAGCKSGVARKANLYLIKTNEVLMNSGLAKAQTLSDKGLLYGFYHILSVLLGDRGLYIPRGKAVVLVCTSLGRVNSLKKHSTEKEYHRLEADYKNVLAALDRQGATVIMAAGNGGSVSNVEQDAGFVPSYVDDTFPQHLATEDSPFIVVGSTNNKGQLSSFTAPGRGNTPVTVYAQGEDVTSYDFLHGTDPRFRSGTSFAAPIVAGLAAYTIGLPSNSNLCPYGENPVPGQDSVGMCIKKHLIRTAFQRVDSNDLLAHEPSQYKYDIPERVLVVSNGASGPTEEEGEGENGGDPTPCWSEDTRNQCKMASINDV